VGLPPLGRVSALLVLAHYLCEKEKKCKNEEDKTRTKSAKRKHVQKESTSTLFSVDVFVLCGRLRTEDFIVRKLALFQLKPQK
jgi:hypothetical protein